MLIPGILDLVFVALIPMACLYGVKVGKTLMLREVLHRRESEGGDPNGTIGRLSFIDRAVSQRMAELVRENQQFQRDIDRLKQAEDGARGHDSRYHSLFENANDAMMIYGFGGRFLDVNQAACRDLGYSRDELLRLSPLQIKSRPHQLIFHEKVQRLREQGFLRVKTEHVTKDGRNLPMEVNASVVDYAGIPAVLGIYRDLSGREPD
jgi:PAS domain S-box-containing protein